MEKAEEASAWPATVMTVPRRPRSATATEAAVGDGGLGRRGHNGDADSEHRERGSGAPPNEGGQGGLETNVGGGGGRGRAVATGPPVSDDDGGRNSTVNGEAARGGVQGRNRGGGGSDEPSGVLDADADAGGGNEGQDGGGDPVRRRGGRNGDVEQKRLDLGGPCAQPMQHSGHHGAGGPDASSPRDGGGLAGRKLGGLGEHNYNSDQENLGLGGLGGQQVQDEAKQLTGGSGGDGLGGAAATNQQSATCPVDKKGKKLRAKRKRKLRAERRNRRRTKVKAAPTGTSSTLLPPSNFLTESVLSWTIKDVLNDKLYEKEVKKVPSQYNSTAQFIDLHRTLLVEETRASLCSVMANFEDFQQDKMRYVSFLGNIKFSIEIDEVLSNEKDLKAVQAVLDLYKMVGKKCHTCAELCKDGMQPGSQKSISSLNCLHQNQAEIVWAPPGTLNGCVAAVLKDFLHLAPKVLICVPNALRLADIIVDLEELSVSDILVLNNIKGLGNCSKYEKFCLEHQSMELYCCLTQCEGSLKGMYTLLNLQAYYHTQCSDAASSCARCIESNLLKFSVKSVIRRFDAIMGFLEESLVYLQNHAASFSLLDPETTKFKELLDNLKQIEVLLHDENLRVDYVKEDSLTPSVDATLVDEAYTLAMSLNERRTASTKLISDILNSLHLPPPESRDNIDRLCIKNSRIIVSTLDCTWQLHEVQMDQLDLMIFQGAGQIKENELVVPLLIPTRRIVLFGDHCHLEPDTKSKPGQEFTWDGRPCRTKYTLADVRDQRGQPDTCTLQATLGAVVSMMKFWTAGLEPPQEFKWDFILDNLKSQYEKIVSKEFRSEDKADRGKKRLETSLDILKKSGVLATNESRTKWRVFKILGWEYVDPANTEAVKKILEQGSIMVGHFRMSRNYYNLKPGQVYVDDKDQALLNPKSDQPASHAVMMIGIGRNVYFRHLGMQNSEGRIFGINGLGRVGKQSVEGLYRIKINVYRKICTSLKGSKVVVHSSMTAPQVLANL
ncbi:hypothetical protein EJB05_26199, partial [Eragrostis curvula]